MKSDKLIYGVGVNDADYKVNKIDTSGKRVRCPVYTQWKNMLARCYAASTHKNQPTYTDCSVAPTWHSFMNFREWMIGQDHTGMHLDKDMLFEGNKVYGPDTCVLITRETNMFLSPRSKDRTLPRGVSRCGNRYRTSTDGGKSWHSFTTIDEALEAYSELKAEAAWVLASVQVDPRVSEILRRRFPLKVTNP